MQNKTLALDSELKKNWKKAGEYWEKYCSLLLEEKRLDEALQGYKNAANAFSNGKIIARSAKSMERRAEALKSIKDPLYIVKKAKSMKSACEFWKEMRSWKDAITTIKIAVNIIKDEIIKKDKPIQIEELIRDIFQEFYYKLKTSTMDAKERSAIIYYMKAKEDKLKSKAYSYYSGGGRTPYSEIEKVRRFILDFSNCLCLDCRRKVTEEVLRIESK